MKLSHNLQHVLLMMEAFSNNNNSKRKKVIVIGAGFSGLSVAYHLTKQQQQQKQRQQQQKQQQQQQIHNNKNNNNKDDETYDEGYCYDVVILEARDRVGGRVFPYDLDGTNIDLGGQWVHEASQKNPMRQLMEELNLSFVEKKKKARQKNDAAAQTTGSSNSKKKNRVFDQHGQPIGHGAFKHASRIFYKALHDYNDNQVDINTSFEDLLDDALASYKNSDNDNNNDDNSSDENSSDENSSDENNNNNNNNHFHQAVMNYLIHRTECYEGGRFYEMSAYLDDIYENLGGPDEIPVGGYKSVLDAILNVIGTEAIRLECPVKIIEYSSTTTTTTTISNTQKDEDDDDDDKVVIHLEDGNTIVGDYCVCTVPLGVLQHRKIQFSPDLPSKRWNAIDAIGMGLLDKIVLKFDFPFWDCYTYFAVSHHTDISRVKDFYDGSHDVGAPVLFQFLGGDAARRVDGPEGMTDDEAVLEAMDALRSVFGTDIPNPIATQVTRWNEDPWAYGAYSFAKIGCTEAAYDEIATPIGNKLLFAGEHTSKTAHSCVHGAWATGKREAHRLTAWLKRRKKLF